MKHIAYIAALAICACTSTGELTPQGSALIAAAKPIADAAIVAAAASHGVPPTTSTAVIAAVDALWGAAQQARAGQPVTNGTTNPAIGTAIAAALPANSSPAKAGAILQVAAEQATAKLPQ